MYSLARQLSLMVAPQATITIDLYDSPLISLWGDADDVAIILPVRNDWNRIAIMYPKISVRPIQKFTTDFMFCKIIAAYPHLLRLILSPEQQYCDIVSQYGVNADRKTLYLDFEELRDFGMDIIADQVGRYCYYHLGSREFELPELKLLVDSVQSAKFITDKKSNELIRKLESLVSKYEAKQLHRQVIISGRVKTMNESIYYNVDKIHEAINAGCQIRFKYFQWTIKKKMELRKDGAWYQISPWH